MKSFFVDGFKEVKILLILELVIFLLVLLLLNTPPNEEVYINFDANALYVSVFIIFLSSILDPKRYFNFWSIIVTLNFCYWSFYFLFLVTNF